jgi:hypothetical protein
MLNTSMKNKFHVRFKKILKENPELEQDAMSDVLDDGTNLEDFTPNTEPSREGDDFADAISQLQQEQLQELQGWIGEINGFLNFLNNSENPMSVQSKLARAVRDTIMDKIKTSQQTKISRIASELGSLHQTLLAFKAQSSNVNLKGV